MDRRKFIRDALLLSAGVGLQVPLFDLSKVQAASGRPDVAVVTGKPYEQLVDKAIEMVGTIGQYVKRNDVVVIKPNIGWDRRPEQAANTHPIIVKQLAKQCLDAGAKRVKVFDRTCNEKRRCYTNSGIKDALDSLGDSRVRLEHIDRRKFAPIEIKQGEALSSWEIYRDALEADCYINVPVAKHHGLAGLTLGIKNVMGVIGGNRGSLHFNLGQNIAELATVVMPSLTIIDATRILLRNGPQGGSVGDVKVLDTLVATTDPVAADGYATTLFGMKSDALDSTREAYKLGLGQMNLDKMNITTTRV